MSVNRPGIAKSSQALVFKKNENRKTTLSSAYNQGTAARPRTTISANLNNVQTRTSVFTSSGAQVYLNPGRALRNVNPQLVKSDNSGLRAGLNQNKGYDIAYMKAMQNHWMSGQGRYNNGEMSTMEKWMVGMAAVTQLAQITSAFVSEVKDTPSTTSTTSTTTARGAERMTGDTTKANTRKAPESLTGMQKAKDSSTLRGAIETAQADKAGLESQLTQLEAGLPAMKEASEAATKQLDEIKPKVEAKKNEVTSKEAEVKTNKGNLSNAEQSLKGSETALSSANADFNTACTNLTSANRTLTSAKANLAQASPTNADGTPNPQYAQLEQAVKDAESKVKLAEEQKETAAGTLEQAKAENNKAKENYLNCKSNFEEAKEALVQSQNELKTLQGELETLKGQQSDAQKKVDDYNKALEDQKNLKADINALGPEIEAQQRRLTELEQKEEKGLKGANDTILSLETKMSGKDGILGNDDDKSLGFKNRKKFEEATELRRNVNYTKLSKTSGEQIGGKTFRTGSYDGEVLYMIGSKSVTLEEFEKQKKLAQGNIL